MVTTLNAIMKSLETVAPAPEGIAVGRTEKDLKHELQTASL